jgi:hypothetical protein
MRHLSWCWAAEHHGERIGHHPAPMVLSRRCPSSASCAWAHSSVLRSPCSCASRMSCRRGAGGHAPTRPRSPRPSKADPACARGMCSGGEVQEPSPARIRALLVTTAPTAPMRREDLALATHATPRRTETPGTGWPARPRRASTETLHHGAMVHARVARSPPHRRCSPWPCWKPPAAEEGSTGRTKARHSRTAWGARATLGVRMHRLDLLHVIKSTPRVHGACREGVAPRTARGSDVCVPLAIRVWSAVACS